VALRQAGAGSSSKPDVGTAPASPQPQSPPAPRPDNTASVGQETDIGKLFALAESLFQRGDLDGSMRALDRLAQIDGNNPKVYFYRGQVMGRKGDLPRSVEAFDRAIALNPNYVDAYILRCATLIDMGRPEPAMADAERLVRIAGNDPRSYNVRGLARMQQGPLSPIRPWAAATRPSSI
jgi:tetratricopeptide (TPR) repeat protein